MSGYVYMITNNLNGKYYIGSHSGRNKNYMGSGVALKRAYAKYGMDNFTKTVLHYCANFQEHEEQLLIALDAANDPDMYNMKNAGLGGMLGYVYTDEELTRRRAAYSGSNNPMYGKTHTPEAREVIRRAATGINNAHYGKPRPEHAKAMRGNSNPNYGKTGELSPNYGQKRAKLYCPHCNQLVAVNVFNRWHNDNCKSNPKNKDPQHEKTN